MHEKFPTAPNFLEWSSAVLAYRPSAHRSNLLHYQEELDRNGLEIPSSARRTAADFAFADVAPDMPVEGWIYRSNLRSFMESLSWLVAYSFDEDDWTAIRLGVANADAEGERWYEYSLHGGDPATPMSLQLAPDAGSSIVHIKALVHPSLVRAVEQSVAIFQHVRNSDPAESA